MRLSSPETSTKSKPGGPANGSCFCRCRGSISAAAAASGGGYNQISDPMAVDVAAGSSDLPEIPDLDRPIQIGLDAVKRLVDADAAVIVDAREADEFAAGHLPGALSMPYDEVSAEPERMENLDAGGRPIVVYCGGGACELSLNLAHSLVGVGHGRVLVFMGGYPEWVNAGYPIELGLERE